MRLHHQASAWPRRWRIFGMPPVGVGIAGVESGRDGWSLVHLHRPSVLLPVACGCGTGALVHTHQRPPAQTGEAWRRCIMMYHDVA